MPCHRILLGVLLFAVLAGRYAQADRWGQRYLPPPTDWKWTNEKWTGDDRPYNAIRSRIKQSIAKTSEQKLAGLVDSFQKTADAKPSDPQAQFSWAYAVLAAKDKGYELGFAAERQTQTKLIYALAGAQSPHDYEYAHLRFMVIMRLGTYLQLKGLGQRLLQRNPQDDQIKFYEARILASGTSSEKKQALVYAQDLVRKRPTWSGSYSALGATYQEMFFATKDIATGDKAIDAYRESLRLRPPNDESRANAEYLIKLIQKYQKKWTKKGV